MHRQVLSVRSVAGWWFCSITWQHHRTIQQPDKKKHVSYWCTKLDCHKIHSISHAESQLTSQICRVAMKTTTTMQYGSDIDFIVLRMFGRMNSCCVPLWRRILPGAYSFSFPSVVLSQRRAEIKEVICTRVFKQRAADLVDLLPAEKNFFFFFSKHNCCCFVDVCVCMCVGPLLLRRRARDSGDEPHSPLNFAQLEDTLHRGPCIFYVSLVGWEELLIEKPPISLPPPSN